MALKKSILIVEDESAIAENITYALETEGFAPYVCGTGQAALQWLKDHHPSLLILDVGLPDMNGFDLCREIRRFSQAPIIFLTARGGEVDRVVGLELGADDYMVKPFSPRELTARVRAILRRASGNEPVPPPPAVKEGWHFAIDKARFTILYHGQPLPLTRYEYRILALLLEHPGRVYSRDALMEQAWEDPGSSLDRTVDAHIKSLRTKLRAIDPKDDPIQTHRGLGYSLRAGV